MRLDSVTTAGLGSSETGARFALLMKTLGTALSDPAHNATTVLVLLGVVGLVLLILLLIAYLIVTLVQDWKNPPPPPVPRAPKREARAGTPVIKAVAWTIVPAVVLVGAIVGYNYGTSDVACARCHFTKRAFASRAADTHAKVACSSCHVAPGAAGAFAAAASGLTNLRIELVSHPADSGSTEVQVQSSACLSCHGSVASGVVVAGGIRMRHSDVLAVGYACTDCHSTVGHGPRAVVPARRATMAQCVQCHDGRKAPGACATCHSRDVGVKSGERAVTTDIPKATITPNGCRGCHPMTTCINCHGLELPHSDAFIQGYHARKALLEPQVCVKCHDTKTFCNGCHQFTVKNGLPTGPHGSVSDFVAMHKGAGPISGGPDSASCSCHTKGGPRQPLCDDCHAKQPER
jgi:hypothetical protein